MRVDFLVPDGAQRAPVADAVARHAAGLRERHGIDARVVAPGAADGCDVAVATGWQTALAVHDAPAAHRAWLLLDMDDRASAADAAQRAAAAHAYELPLAMITQARWITEQLEILREDRHVRYVRAGIEKEIFGCPAALAPNVAQPLRVLVEAGDADAVAAVAEMREPHLVAELDVAGAAPAERAAAYAGADVLVRLARVEGMATAPLEAFHCGATCITTAVTGHDEYVVDGANALVTSWDDRRGTARLLDLLATDRRLLHELRLGALRTAASWPSTQQSTSLLALALRQIAEGR